MKVIGVLTAIFIVLMVGCAQQSSTTTTKDPKPAAPAVDRNQQIVDQYMSLPGASKDLAPICDYERVAPGAARKMTAHILGPQILNSGGDVSVVTEDLLARC